MGDCATELGRLASAYQTGVPAFSSAFSARAGAHADHRNDFAAWLDLLPTSPDEAFELTLVFSELVTNAAATSPDGSGQIRVTGSFDGANLTLAVENPTPDTKWIASTWDLEDSLRGGGRGLVIVRTYTDQLQVTQSSRSATLVRCRRTLGAERTDGLAALVEPSQAV